MVLLCNLDGALGLKGRQLIRAIAHLTEQLVGMFPELLSEVGYSPDRLATLKSEGAIQIAEENHR